MPKTGGSSGETDFVRGGAALALCAALSTGPAWAGDPDAALAALKTTVLSLGPNGEKPTAASTVMLTDDELAKVKAMHATAAMVLHYARQRLVAGAIDA